MGKLKKAQSVLLALSLSLSISLQNRFGVARSTPPRPRLPDSPVASDVTFTAVQL